MKARGVVEAALFTSSGPLSMEELMDRTNLSAERIENVLKDLERVYDMIDSAMRIGKVGGGYSIMLREEYVAYTERYVGAELTKGMMKTLATIAYNQPITQSELNRNIGSRVYEDVPALAEMGLIHAKKIGQTKELTTTRRFLEYFGIDSSTKDGIRKWIESLGQN